MQRRKRAGLLQQLILPVEMLVLAYRGHCDGVRALGLRKGLPCVSILMARLLIGKPSVQAKLLLLVLSHILSDNLFLFIILN
jgi:hypothetical protein